MRTTVSAVTSRQPEELHDVAGEHCRPEVAPCRTGRDFPPFQHLPVAAMRRRPRAGSSLHSAWAATSRSSSWFFYRRTPVTLLRVKRHRNSSRSARTPWSWPILPIEAPLSRPIGHEIHDLRGGARCRLLARPRGFCERKSALARCDFCLLLVVGGFIKPGANCAFRRHGTILQDRCRAAPGMADTAESDTAAANSTHRSPSKGIVRTAAAASPAGACALQTRSRCSAQRHVDDGLS